MKQLTFILVVLCVALLTGYASAQASPGKARVIGGPTETEARTNEHRIYRDTHRSLFVYHNSGANQARVVTAKSVDAGGKNANDRIVNYRIIGTHDAINLDADMRRQEEDPIDDNHHLLQVQRLGRYLNRQRAHVVRHPMPQKLAAEEEEATVRSKANPRHIRPIDKDLIVKAK